jgi:hypothetical protein
MRAVIPPGHAEALIATLPRLLVVLRKAVPQNTFAADLLPDEVRASMTACALRRATRNLRAGVRFAPDAAASPAAAESLAHAQVRSQRNIVGLLSAYVGNIKSFRIRAIKLGFIPLWQRLFDSAAEGPVVIQATRSVLAICKDSTCSPYFQESGGSISWMVCYRDHHPDALVTGLHPLHVRPDLRREALRTRMHDPTN